MRPTHGPPFKKTIQKRKTINMSSTIFGLLPVPVYSGEKPFPTDKDYTIQVYFSHRVHPLDRGTPGFSILAGRNISDGEWVGIIVDQPTLERVVADIAAEKINISEPVTVVGRYFQYHEGKTAQGFKLTDIRNGAPDTAFPDAEFINLHTHRSA